MRSTRYPPLVALALLLAALASSGGPPDDPTREPTDATPAKLILVSWDGAADWVVDRLLAEGELPHLARLAERGAAADHLIAHFPSKTAPGHAAIFTGCWGDCNGVANNRVPVFPAAEHTRLEHRRGFSSTALTAEPLYVTAARAGRRVAVLSATQSDPPAPHLATLRAAGVPEDRYFSVSGFEYRLAYRRLFTAEDLEPAGEIWRRSGLPWETGRELRFRVADDDFVALVYDDPDDPADGLDRLSIHRLAGDGTVGAAVAALSPRPAVEGDPTVALAAWSPPIPVLRGDLAGNTFFRLWELTPDGRRMALYQRQVYALEGTAADGRLDAYREAYPGFHDSPFFAYREGFLGPTLMEGGDGTAERRAVESAAFDVELVIGGSRFALARWQPELLFHYTPLADGAGHTWMGVLDPESPAHDPALAERLWAFYRGIYRQIDRWLGALMEAAPPETIIALVSDHGMLGTGSRISVNGILREAGLLATTADGEIDLARTRVLQPAWADFFLTVNGTDRAGGVVPPDEREAALAAAEEALLGAVDPRTGRHLFQRIFRAEEHPDLGIGGPAGGDLYFDPAPGYYPVGDVFRPLARATRDSWGTGEHGYWPYRRKMHAIFYAAGPGIGAGRKVGSLRQIDVAPTLAALLGIPAPADSRGRVVRELFAAP